MQFRLICAFMLSAPVSLASSVLPPTVEHRGALKNIMHKGDLSAVANLMMFDGLPHIYALGAVARLKGEIVILDSRPFVSFVDDGELRVDSTLNYRAALLVYAQVQAWQSVKIPARIKSYTDLETFIPTRALAAGLDTARAFPFLITGELYTVDWHVIDWPEGDTVHTHDKHKAAGTSGTLSGKPVTVLGFYSTKHHAIFTHHTTNMHMHLVSDDGKTVGHVDDLRLAPGVKLWLPE